MDVLTGTSELVYLSMFVFVNSNCIRESAENRKREKDRGLDEAVSHLEGDPVARQAAANAYAIQNAQRFVLFSCVCAAVSICAFAVRMRRVGLLILTSPNGIWRCIFIVMRRKSLNNQF